MSITKNEKQQNDYLRVILEEIRSLASQVKKIDAEIKDLKKHISSHHNPPVS